MLGTAEVALRQRDFAAAEEACRLALAHDPKQYFALYKIAEICRARGDGEGEAAKLLEGLFAHPSHAASLIMLADVALSARYLENAEKYVSAVKSSGKHAPDAELLRGRLLYMKGDFDAAKAALTAALGDGGKPEILPCLTESGARALSALHLLTLFRGGEAGDMRQILSGILGARRALVLRQAEAVLSDGTESLLAGEPEAAVLSCIAELLKEVLSCGEFELFEKLLQLYNRTDSKKALLSLAGVYADCGFTSLAASVVMSSVKELGALDAKGAQLLLRFYGGG